MPKLVTHCLRTDGLSQGPVGAGMTRPMAMVVLTALKTAILKLTGTQTGEEATAQDKAAHFPNGL